MGHPAVYVAAAVVCGVAALIGFLVGRSQQNQHKTGYGRGGSGSGTRYMPPSPPPTPPPSSTRRRRRSPERRSNSPVRSPTSAHEQHVTCRNCGESPHITVKPCNHKSLCKGCYESRIENDDTCPDCQGRIDSCSPPIPPFAKCSSCRKFTKLFEFLPCNHSLSLCIKCFEEQNRSYKNCPECDQKIVGSKPAYSTSGICGICPEFTQFALFQPCGHGAFCRKHASQYLESSGEECSECANGVTGVV